MARKKRKKPIPTPHPQPAAGQYVDWALDDDGHLVAVDEVEHLLAIERPDGRFTFVGREGSEPGCFRYPRAIEILDGIAYVVDSWNHRVQMYDVVLWKLVGTFGEFGAGRGQFFCPSSIVAISREAASHWLCIADTNNNRISFHSRDGSCLFTTDLGGTRYPSKVRTRDGFLQVQYEDGEWARLVG